jgi:hypothetical protein
MARASVFDTSDPSRTLAANVRQGDRTATAGIEVSILFLGVYGKTTVEKSRDGYRKGIQSPVVGSP